MPPGAIPGALFLVPRLGSFANSDAPTLVIPENARGINPGSLTAQSAFLCNLSRDAAVRPPG